MSRRPLILVLVALSLLSAACGGTEVAGNEAAADPDAEGRRSVATVAPAPGDVVDVRPLPSTSVPPGAFGWAVTYRSTDAHGEPIEVGGTVWAPDDETGDDADDRPVISWGHPPTGIADSCAPNLVGSAPPLLPEMLEAGYVVAATNYAGQGTDDPHIGLVATTAAHDVLDIARAANNLPQTRASRSVVAYGHSQGAHAALSAAREIESYARDLDLVGVVATSPPMDPSVLVSGLASKSRSFGFYAQIAYGYAEVYDELALEDVLTPTAIERLEEQVHVKCAAEIVADFADDPLEELVTMPPHEHEGWRTRFAENDLSTARLDAPVLLLHGDVDIELPWALTQAGAHNLCSKGNSVEFHKVPGGTHHNIYELEGARVLDWMAARLAGEPETPTC